MLKGKTIIITGASSGIGKAITTNFLKDGANIVMNSRNKNKLEDIIIENRKYSAQSVIPTMIKQNNGYIINIGSMWVDNPLIQTPCSGSQVSKAGMHTLTKHLAIEFAQNNIRVNTIAPAIIETPLYDNLMSKEDLSSLSSLHSLNKLGNITDIYLWVKHLATKGSRFVTGQTFFIDGEITAGGHR